jgi:hypothetical protein
VLLFNCYLLYFVCVLFYLLFLLVFYLFFRVLFYLFHLFVVFYLLAQQTPSLSTNLNQIFSTIQENNVVLVLFNSVGWERMEYVELAISNITVRNAKNGTHVETQTLKNGNTVFCALIPAVGFSTFFLENANNSEHSTNSEMNIEYNKLVRSTKSRYRNITNLKPKNKQSLFIENQYFKITLDSTTGQPQTILLQKFNQTFSWTPLVCIFYLFNLICLFICLFVSFSVYFFLFGLGNEI